VVIAGGSHDHSGHTGLVIMPDSSARTAVRSRQRPAPSERIVAVVVVIFTVDNGRLKVLLIHRSAAPQRDSWSLPGGLLGDSESLQGAAVRKLAEETGLADVYLEQLYTFSDLDETGTVAVAYFALVDVSEALLAERNDWLPAWFPVAEAPALAFRNNEVIDYALSRLRAKLDYSNVAYSLLPEEFTLSQLQGTYEGILGKRLDKRNFRKRVITLGLLEATGRRSGAGRHRPAQLYRFRERKPVVF
jgi:8-oxo-dGTP diphosphatase